MSASMAPGDDPDRDRRRQLGRGRSPLVASNVRGGPNTRRGLTLQVRGFTPQVAVSDPPQLSQSARPHHQHHHVTLEMVPTIPPQRPQSSMAATIELRDGLIKCSVMSPATKFQISCASRLASAAFGKAPRICSTSIGPRNRIMVGMA